MMDKSGCMERALYMAEKGRYLASPNPMVGCVITKNNKIIGEGWHQRYGENHAEINAIDDVRIKFGDEYLNLLKNSTFYTTLEPCSKKGKTGSCAETLVKLEVAKIIIGSRDPSQEGIEFLNDNGITTEDITLELQNAAYKLNRGFFSRVIKGRPFIKCKIGMSVDGGICLETGESKWITSEDSRQDVHKLRAESDVIFTGSGTVKVDDPLLTVRGVSEEFNPPLRCIADRGKTLQGREKLLNDGLETLIFTNGLTKNITSKAEYKEAPLKEGFLDLQEIMSSLGEINKNMVLVEAGPKIINSLIQEKLIDEFIFYSAPKVLGNKKISFLDNILNNSKLGKINLLIDDIKSIGQDLKITATPIYN
tara:strand:+ start:583 stop:1677 length:1095 start_codon:yes stop_codon:yes gene_type:complete